MPDNIELNNAREFPKMFYCRHMEPGICGYEKEKILVDADAMKNMSASFAGKPLYVGHQKVDVSKIQEQADGYVTKCFYNGLDGWLWAEFIAVSDKAKDAISKGWSVSNAYVPSEFAGSGEHHAVDFDRKIVNAIFTHLAIVPNPRYEGAKIFTPDEYKVYCEAKKTQLDELKNSKGAKKMFKGFFKNEKKEITNAADVDDSTMVELENGKSVSIKEMIETIENAKTKKNADDGAKEEKKEDNKDLLNDDSEVDVGGKKVKIGDLKNSYKNEMKKNEADEKAKKEADEKKNAEDEKAKKDKDKEDEEKKNAKTFEEMKNAKNKAADPIRVDTSLDKVARGQARYGSNK